MSDAAAVDAARIIEVLNRHGVDYIVIGAWAVEAQGIRRSEPTRDIDITPSKTAGNLRRLSAALHELDTRIRTTDIPDRLPFDHGATSLCRSIVWNLICPAGEFVISYAPSGFPGGYEELNGDSVIVNLPGDLNVRVASVSDVVASKQSAGRPKDIKALPEIIEQARQRGLID